MRTLTRFFGRCAGRHSAPFVEVGAFQCLYYLVPYIDLGNRGYFGVEHHSCFFQCHTTGNSYGTNLTAEPLLSILHFKINSTSMNKDPFICRKTCPSHRAIPYNSYTRIILVYWIHWFLFWYHIIWKLCQNWDVFLEVCNPKLSHLWLSLLGILQIWLLVSWQHEQPTANQKPC